jgi:hypothetical protein
VRDVREGVSVCLAAKDVPALILGGHCRGMYKHISGMGGSWSRRDRFVFVIALLL